MGQKSKLETAAVCALLCALCISHAAAAQALPDGKGKAEFVDNCTACHRADMVTAVKKTPDGWRKSVDEMASRGTPGTKEDLDNVYLYLVKNYSADKPAPAVAPQPTTPPLSAEDVAYVKRIIAQNGCLVCHRIEQQGGYTGPSLNGVGTRRTSDQLHASISAPPPTLDPANALFRVTAADGSTVVGRILTQDDQQLQIIDASGKVTTYPKPGLQLSPIKTNPMPSFEGRITGEDLDDVVRYLISSHPCHKVLRTEGPRYSSLGHRPRYFVSTHLRAEGPR